MFRVYLKPQTKTADISSGQTQVLEKEYSTDKDAYADFVAWPDSRLYEIKLAYNGTIYIDGNTIRNEAERQKSEALV
jgi:hypothetical protein